MEEGNKAGEEQPKTEEKPQKQEEGEQKKDMVEGPDGVMRSKKEHKKFLKKLEKEKKKEEVSGYFPSCIDLMNFNRFLYYFSMLYGLFILHLQVLTYIYSTRRENKSKRVTTKRVRRKKKSLKSMLKTQMTHVLTYSVTAH